MSWLRTLVQKTKTPTPTDAKPYRMNCFRNRLPLDLAQVVALVILLGSQSGCVSWDPKGIAPGSAVQEVTKEDAERIRDLAQRWDVEPIPIHTNRHVFYDDAVIRSRDTSIVRRICKATKWSDNPIIEADRKCERIELSREGLSWITGIGVYCSFFRDEEGRFQAFYQSENRKMGLHRLCVAYSDDGISWIKPRIFPNYDNVVFNSGHGIGVYYDLHTDQAGARYKMVFGGTQNLDIRKGIYGLCFAHARDGTRWKVSPVLKELFEPAYDTQNSLIWDDELDAYRIYTRIWTRHKTRLSRQYLKKSIVQPTWKLASAIITGFSFGVDDWYLVDDIGIPRVRRFPNCQIYGLAGHKMGPIYVANVMAYYPNDECLYYCLATSRDGVGWDLSWSYPNASIIARGPKGSVDEYYVAPPSTPAIEVGDELYIYYTGSRAPHVTPDLPEGLTAWAICLAKTRRDGLFFLENERGEGEVITKSFLLEGNVLELNVDADGSLEGEGYSEGELRVLNDMSVSLPDLRPNEAIKVYEHDPTARLSVALLDKDGDPISGFTYEDCDIVKQDACNIRVSWNGQDKLDCLSGQEIAIAFKLVGSVRLYAFEILAK